MRQDAVPVVIVESHQHVLEHVHDVLRKKKLFRDEWSMVHFDAHPDLACSKTAPAVAFFNPRHYYYHAESEMDGDEEKDEENSKNLYELLDLTASGIAEWIMPLVLAAKLHKIEWIKPSFSSQMAPGKYRFAVGAECGDNSGDEITSYLDLPTRARVKVDLEHPYYLDDASVTTTARLVLKQTLELQVSELGSILSEQKEDDRVTSKRKSLWTLDICLDYFACENPYITDLESTSPQVTRAFLAVMESSRFNANSSNGINTSMSSTEYQTEILCFYKLLEELLQKYVNRETNHLTISANSFTVTSSSALREISKYFETAEEARELILQLIHEINDESGDRTALLKMVVEAIPNWSMPHDKSSAAREEMDISLGLVEAHIQRHVAEKGNPFMVTMARSTLDGFCPPKVVEWLQEKVLDILRRQICRDYNNPNANGDTSPLLIVRDYGEWEGSVISWEGNS